jgi:hypothetical protein
MFMDSRLRGNDVIGWDQRTLGSAFVTSKKLLSYSTALWSEGAVGDVPTVSA